MARPKMREPSETPYTRRQLLAGWWGVLIVVEDGFPQPPHPPSTFKEMEPDEGVAALLKWCAIQDRAHPLIPPATWVGRAERAIAKVDA